MVVAAASHRSTEEKRRGNKIMARAVAQLYSVFIMMWQ
jgi:hypothetical protein